MFFGTSRENSRVEYEVEFLGNIVVLLEIFYRSSISLRFLLASYCTRAEAFQNYKLWYKFLMYNPCRL